MGVPHEYWGQQVAAVVVVDVDAEAIDAYCRDHEALADFKRPREYVITEDALPRSDTGTLLRGTVLDRYFGA